jgi:hypothetical protein
MMGPGMMGPPPGAPGGPPKAAPSRSSRSSRSSSRSRRNAPAPVEEKPVERGFLIQVTVITPNANPIALVDASLIKGVMALTRDTMGPNRNYYVAKAMIVERKTIEQDEPRMQALQTAYESLVGERRAMARGGAGGARGRGPAGMPGMAPGMNPMMDPAMMGGMMPPGMDLPGGRGPAMPGGGRNARNNGRPGAEEEDPNKPFQDRATGESVLKDSVVTVLLAVVVDPPPKKAEGDSSTAMAP